MAARSRADALKRSMRYTRTLTPSAVWAGRDQPARCCSPGPVHWNPGSGGNAAGGAEGTGEVGTGWELGIAWTAAGIEHIRLKAFYAGDRFW